MGGCKGLFRRKDRTSCGLDIDRPPRNPKLPSPFGFTVGPKTAETTITATLSKQLDALKAESVHHPVEGAEYHEIEVYSSVEAVSQLGFEGDQEWFVRVVRAAMQKT